MATKVVSMKLEIYQNSVWTEYEIFDNKFKITQQIDVFEGKIKDSIVDISVKYSNSLYNYLIQNKNVNARLYINNSIIFSGYIECKLKVIRNTRLPEKIDLNIVGFYNKLRKKYKIIKKYTSQTPAYIINDLLSIANLSLYSTPAGLTDITLTKTFDLSVITPAEIIEKLLYECGFTGYEKYITNNNYLVVDTIKKNLPSDYTYQENIVEGVNYQIVNEVVLNKNTNDIDEVSIKYYDLESFSNQILFEDTTNQNSIYRCYIPIAPNGYYQDNASGVYLDLTFNKNNQSFEILDISSATLDIQKDSSIQVIESYLTSDNRYFVKIKNNDPTNTRYIYKLQLKCNGNVKKNINFRKIDISDGDKKIEYEMKYIQNAIKSQNLCDSLAHLYKYSNYNVNFDCYTHNGLFSKCRLDNIKGLGTLNCVTSKLVIDYELNKNIIYNTENLLIGDVITYTVNQETIINSNPVINEISNNQQIPTTQQTLIGNVEDINFIDEDNDDVVLKLAQEENEKGKYLAIQKRYRDTDTFKDYGNLRLKKIMLEDIQVEKTITDVVQSSQLDVKDDLGNLSNLNVNALMIQGLPAVLYSTADGKVVLDDTVYQKSWGASATAPSSVSGRGVSVFGMRKYVFFGNYVIWKIGPNIEYVEKTSDTTTSTKIYASNITGNSNDIITDVLVFGSYLYVLVLENYEYGDTENPRLYRTSNLSSWTLVKSWTLYGDNCRLYGNLFIKDGKVHGVFTDLFHTYDNTYIYNTDSSTIYKRIDNYPVYALHRLFNDDNYFLGISEYLRKIYILNSSFTISKTFSIPSAIYPIKNTGDFENFMCVNPLSTSNQMFYIYSKRYLSNNTYEKGFLQIFVKDVNTIYFDFIPSISSGFSSEYVYLGYAEAFMLYRRNMSDGTLSPYNFSTYISEGQIPLFCCMGSSLVGFMGLNSSLNPHWCYYSSSKNTITYTNYTVQKAYRFLSPNRTKMILIIRDLENNVKIYVGDDTTQTLKYTFSGYTYGFNAVQSTNYIIIQPNSSSLNPLGTLFLINTSDADNGNISYQYIYLDNYSRAINIQEVQTNIISITIKHSTQLKYTQILYHIQNKNIISQKDVSSITNDDYFTLSNNWNNNHSIISLTNYLLSTWTIKEITRQLGYGIIETGSNTNGYWVKWSNGFTICWGSGAKSNVSISNAYGSLYLNAFSITFPITFTSCGGATISKCQWGTGASWGYTYSVSTTSATYRIIDAVSRGNGDVNYMYYAWGYS